MTRGQRWAARDRVLGWAAPDDRMLAAVVSDPGPLLAALLGHEPVLRARALPPGEDPERAALLDAERARRRRSGGGAA